VTCCNPWVVCSRFPVPGSCTGGCHPQMPSVCVCVVFVRLSVTGSCAGSCGEQAEDGDCWCNQSCVGFRDCCSDFEETCDREFLVLVSPVVDRVFAVVEVFVFVRGLAFQSRPCRSPRAVLLMPLSLSEGTTCVVHERCTEIKTARRRRAFLRTTGSRQPRLKCRETNYLSGAVCFATAPAYIFAHDLFSPNHV